MKKIQQGFSLIEAMATVLIFSILMAVSYPSYLEYTKRSARADTKSALLENTQYLESNFTTNNCYHRNDGNCANSALNVTLPVTQSPRTGDTKYIISFLSFSRDTYTLRSVPSGTQVGDKCGTFTLTHTGQKGITGGTGDTSNCW
jgi:type IV pilus assembly protein PilE